MDKPSPSSSKLSEEPEALRSLFMHLEQHLENVVLGQKDVIRLLLTSLLSEGHALLEGPPGVAKTKLCKELSLCLGAQFNRIQFTPDLLPSDLLGTEIFQTQQGSFKLHKGPLFSEIVLADEINRAPPKVQSALLEVMAEKQISIGEKSYPLGNFFWVVATRNPIEHEGTYALPEAATDRFSLLIHMGYPNHEAESALLHQAQFLEKKENIPPLKREILEKAFTWVKKIYVDRQVEEYTLRLIRATRHPEEIDPTFENTISLGASPRAGLHLLSLAKAKAFLEGRSYTVPQDIRDLFITTLIHRIKLTYTAQAKGWSNFSFLKKIIDKTPLP